MKLKVKLSALHIFIIILLALGICSFIGAITYEGFHESTMTSNKANKDIGMGMGITKNMIPEGDEELYILKSQIVPPVCPACPSITNCPEVKSDKKCPPCPPCGRCPEPSFECKKVPNYSALKQNKVVPRAVLSDFSSFGM